MKLKMTIIYGEPLCEALKETFGCDTDQELLVIMKASMAKEVIDPEDLSVVCELVD